MENNWIVKQLGSINYFSDEITANQFAAAAKTTLLRTVDVEVAQQASTGRWMVQQSLTYITTEKEDNYALPVV